MSFSSSLWLIGSGPMAKAYASVLQAQNIAFRVIGRGADSAEAFQQSTGVPVVGGGLDRALTKLPAPTQAIVAVGVEQLAAVTEKLISGGCQRLLLEKPGALHFPDLEALDTAVQRRGAQVWIAYNRRFYTSVEKLRELVAADGGITSAFFEFTEWSHKIRPLQKHAGVKERWLLANSSHVLDLVFNLIGFPAKGQWQAWHEGSLDWHPASARFHGAGLTEYGIPFAYQSDWEAPGRWGIEILTRKNRYILRPLEVLQAVPLGSTECLTIPIDDAVDKIQKPGLYLQCQAFLSCETERLCTLSEQIKAFPIYARIAGYVR